MFNIKVEPSDVDKFVTEALMKSMLGDRLSDAINKAIEGLMHGYGSPIYTICRENLSDHVRARLSSEPWKTKIEGIIAAKFTNEFVENLMGNALDKAIKELRESQKHDY